MTSLSIDLSASYSALEKNSRYKYLQLEFPKKYEPNMPSKHGNAAITYRDILQIRDKQYRLLRT